MARGSGIGPQEGELTGRQPFVCMWAAVEEGESSPVTGHLSARPAGKPGSLLPKEGNNLLA